MNQAGESANNASPPVREGGAKAGSPLLSLLIGLLVAMAAFFGAALATWAYQALQAKPEETKTVTTLVATPSVITAVRDLATLESASYHIERVIDLRDRQSHLFGLFQSEDAVLLVAAADVVAGVDLTTMSDGDIRFDHERRTANLVLPPPRVLSARLDNDRTYVHTRNTDALAIRAETLETRARQEAERALHQAALDAGLLERARTNAARTIRTLVQSLGYDRVEVTFRED